MIPNREEALQLLQQYNDDPALLRHALTVEGVMRHFAGLCGADADLWGVVGLLHDIDYQRFPQQHCHKAMELLGEAGVDETVIRAVASHGWGFLPGLPEPLTPMENTLYATDELTGLIHACAIMRPSRSVLDLELKSVKKKFKQANFAAGVSREVITAGAGRLGMELDELIWQTVLGMRACADAIGLGGNEA